MSLLSGFRFPVSGFRSRLGPALIALAVSGEAPAAPAIVQTAPGRFEISGVDASVAHAVAAQAEEAWRILAGPLGLPDAFPSPVFVRIAPAGERADAAPFHVTVEAGGVVSLRLRVAETPLPHVRRGLVQSLLMRLAVSWHGVNERLTVPLWLEHGCVGWWQTRADGAQLDALKQESAIRPAPELAALLGWQRGAEEPRAFAVASVWLMTFLQSESSRTREWPGLLQRLLIGADAEAALAASFGDRFGDAADRELWWRTGWHHVRRIRTLPTLDAEESHAQVAALLRFLFSADGGESDIVVPLRTVLARTAEPIVATELARRRAELGRLTPALHPFYRNAGLSLAEAMSAAAGASATRRAALCAAFEQDWRDAMELAAAAKAALDALEARAR